MKTVAGLAATVLWLAPLAGEAAEPGEAASSPSAKRLLALFQREASDYDIYRDAERREKLIFNSTPIYSWTNPAKDALQQGVLFVWTHRGCAEVVGGVWSQPLGARRGVFHEFNSFSRELLKPVRASQAAFTWSPQSAVKRLPIAGAALPGGTAERRLLQLRALAREFSAHTVSPGGERWQLRVLAQPLYRYQSADDAIVDGGVFAFVSSAGTDPEILMVIEAAKVAGAGRWQSAFGRLSVYNAYVERGGRQVWSSVLGDDGTAVHDAAHTFEFYQDKLLDELPDEGGDAARRDGGSN